MAYKFSPSSNAFYPEDLRADYEAAGTWPSDAVAVTESCFAEFALGAPPEGKRRGVIDGHPAWVNHEPPAMSAAQLLAACEAALGAAINKGAKSWGYDDIVSAASYVNSTVSRFKAEAKALIAWRDAAWTWAQGVLDSAKAGGEPPASVDAFIAAAPVMPIRPNS